MKICSVPNCRGKHYSLGYCEKHYRQYRKYGHILERTHFDKNEIIEYEDYAELILLDKEGIEVARTIIDLDDIDKVKNIKWYMNSEGYIVNSTIGRMHRFIMNCPEDMVVDHINHNKLDNRKCNLRICTIAENNKNRKKQNGNYRSQYKGVGWHKNSGKWSTIIYINNKRKYIGLYDDELEASIEYDKASIMYHGAYCKTNHPIENYIDYIIGLGLDPTDFGIEEGGADI